MNIIIEGPDNVGKSTLINNLKNSIKHKPISTIHYSNLKHSSIEECIEYNKMLYSSMFQLMENKPENSILTFDRSHLGEMVYGKIYRGYEGDYVIDIEKKYVDRDFFINVFLITLIDEPTNLINREDGLSFSASHNREEELKLKNTEVQRFREAHRLTLIKNKIIINVSNYDETALLQEALDFVGY